MLVSVPSLTMCTLQDLIFNEIWKPTSTISMSLAPSMWSYEMSENVCCCFTTVSSRALQLKVLPTPFSSIALSLLIAILASSYRSPLYSMHLGESQLWCCELWYGLLLPNKLRFCTKQDKSLKYSISKREPQTHVIHLFPILYSRKLTLFLAQRFCNWAWKSSSFWIGFIAQIVLELTTTSSSLLYY